MLSVTGSFHAQNRCPKCAGRDVSANYRKEGHSSGYPHFQRDQHDVIDRHCRRCSYEWAEWALDAPPALESLLQQMGAASTSTSKSDTQPDKEGNDT